ncbi:ribonuclease P protein component [bacterium]|nr:MAG: ribonuclease P protein component [bacterium]MCL4232247.1 ribonuclease P protein component [Dehalococcoidia bacterium]
MERARRLRKGDEFDTAYREGTVTGGPLLALRRVPNGLDVTRWGFAVGKRLSKRAVVRNRTKRRLREAARMIAVVPGFDLIVTARQGATEASFAELRAALVGLLRRSRLLAGGEEG